MLLLFCNHSHLFILIFILIFIFYIIVHSSSLIFCHPEECFSVIFSVDLLVTNSLVFVSLKTYFLPLFSKDIFVKYRIIGWQFYFLLIL